MSVRLAVGAFAVGLLVIASAAADPGSSPFGPLKPPPVPVVRANAGRNPVDAFVAARLAAAGLEPSAEADPLTLLRRVTYDLTGLLPTPAERAAFLADTAPGAYERVVDRLLASPAFGERWAQHWLDVVRFAETEGFKLDRHRPDAFRYRDYVIRGFNADLPYDQFLIQQIAGDEREPDNPDAIVATGYLRLHPEESNGGNYMQIRQDILDDVTDVFGLTFLGLTFGCARCHDHKFDPITQEDYFELQAFFAPLIHRDDYPLAAGREKAEYARRQAAWEQATAAIRAEIKTLVEPPSRAMFEELIVAFDATTQKALRTSAEKRTPLQRQLVALASKQIDRRVAKAYRRLQGPQRARYDELQKQLAAFDHLKPPSMPTAMAAADDDSTTPPETRRLLGGNYAKPREAVEPDFPECLAPDEHPAILHPTRNPRSTGRRSALAAWLTRPDHPLTARVIVNRLWQPYFGRGIVATPNDFGATGEKPTHPELLDWLAAELIRNDWRLKPIHRLIVTSATYRQSSQPTANPNPVIAAKADPLNRLLWHANAKRRDGEAIRDAILQTAGRLNTRMFGASAQPELPAALKDSKYAWEPDETPSDRDRRSVYVLAKRAMPLPLLAAFDQPDRHLSCATRPVTTTAPQALALLNGEFCVEQARHFAARLLPTHREDLAGLVRAAYLAAYGREPAADEAAEARGFLADQSKRAGGLDAATADLCQALLNSAEFLEID